MEHKSDPLVGTIEPSMYIGRFQWNNIGKSDHLSPYAHECCDNLVKLYSVSNFSTLVFNRTSL